MLSISFQGSHRWLVFTALFAAPVMAETYDQCLSRQFHTADDSKTLKEIRTLCRNTAQAASNPVEHRADLEKKNRGNRFTITPHRPNYILPVSYNKTPNKDPFKQHLPEEDFANTEIKFQLSLKAPLSEGGLSSR